MTSTNTSPTDGNTGLGVLVLMTMALIAGEAHSRLDVAATSVVTPPSVGQQILFDSTVPDRSDAIRGAIRELKVLPATIDSRLDLNWKADEYLIQEYQQAGF